MSKTSINSLKFSEAYSAIWTILRARLVPMLKGSPGIGKSALARKLATDNNLALIDIRLSQVDPTELLGFPQINGDRADYVPMKMFPLEGDALPLIDPKDPSKGSYDGWLLFLDEMNAAPPSVQVASYKIMLERMVGNRNLHSKVLIMGAGNLDSDRAVTEDMSTALQSRLIHLQIRADLDDFIEYAYSKNFSTYIINFLQFKPDALYTFKPDHDDVTYACNRTWEFADKILKVNSDFKDPLLRTILSGTISSGIAAEFIGFCTLKIPHVSDILKSPETFEIPKEPSITFALLGHLYEHTTKANFDDIYKYVHRMGREFQFIYIKSIVKRKPEFRDHPVVENWITEMTAKLQKAQ